MRVPVSLTDPRLDVYRTLRDKDLLRERGLFIAEGRMVVRRLLEHGGFEVISLLLSAAAAEDLGPLAERPDVPAFILPASEFEHLVGVNVHRGCLAAARRGPEREWTSLAGPARRIVALEGIADADNVGSIFRHAAGFGVDAVLLDPATVDPLYRKAIRTSMGATLRVPFARVPVWTEALAALTADGVALVGLTPSPAAEPLRTVAARLAGRRVALLLGHEGQGLTADTMAQATVLARIPMAEGADSLNVAAAAAIALYEVAHAGG